MATEARIVTQGGDEPMGELPITGYPRRVIVWNIRLEEAGGDIDLRIAGAKDVDLPDNSYASFKNYLDQVVRGDEPSSWDPVVEPIPGPSSLSLSFNQHAYMIFVLRGQNWQFSRGQRPFTVEKNRSEYYKTARCAWVDPISGGVVVLERAHRQVRCEVAYFIADAAGDQEEHGDLTVPDRDFRTSFNIFVDLILERAGGGSRYLPIVIDPDVGYPEGTTPP